VDRVIQHWNSKSVLSKFKNSKVAVRNINTCLKSHSEQTIKSCIDIYHNGLLNPLLRLGKKNKHPPGRVSLAEFFEFSEMTKCLIRAKNIRGFEKVNSWFELCLMGEQELENRFVLVQKDKYPIITRILKDELRSWQDSRFPIMGDAVERQLRRTSEKLVELHQQIRHRLTTHGITKASTPAFVNEHFIPYLRSLDLSVFRLYWLTGEIFLERFTQHLEGTGYLHQPILVRNLKRRAGSDQIISQRGRSRETYRDRDDCQYELSAADYENL